MTRVRQGMVLAAGRGERMRPLTDHCPKPLIAVGGVPMIDRAIDALAHAGVERLVVNSCYLAPMLEAHLSKRAGLAPVFSREDVALETGGGIQRALSHFGDAPFYCLNGDVVWTDGETPALENLALRWHDGLDALLLLHPTERAIGYAGAGDFQMDAGGVLTRRAGAEAPLVYTGIQILHPRLFGLRTRQGAFSLNMLYDEALAARPPRLRGVVHDGEWLHVGDVAGLQAAEAKLRRR